MSDYENLPITDETYNSNEEILEDEFYFKDFTIVSDWEILIARIEDIISQWKSKQLNEQNNELWNIDVENLTFTNIDFRWIFFKKRNDSHNEACKSNYPLDFPLYDDDFILNHDQLSESHNDNMLDDFRCLSSWFGLEYFAVIKSANEEDNVMTESLIKTMLSCINMAMNDSDFHIPIFIEVEKKRMFAGIYEANNIRTKFDIIHLKQGPYTYFNEILDLFKSHINSPSRTIDDITLSYEATYILEDFSNYLWHQTLEFDNIENMFILPFGISMEPIECITLKLLWNNLSHNSITDTKLYSDFNPVYAPIWRCAITLNQQATGGCLLAGCLSEFCAASVPNNSLMSSKIWQGRLLSDKEPWLSVFSFLFPEEDSPFSYSKESTFTPSKRIFSDIDINAQFRGIKSCQQDSLLYRFSIILLNYFQREEEFHHLWSNFVKKIKWHWETANTINGLISNVPDLKTCLLNQKFQLLNYCINQKQSSMNKNYEDLLSSDEEEVEDDEFFDAVDNDDFNDHKENFFSNKPMGRLSKLHSLKLIRTGENLYIPITQDAVFKTEDQLEADVDLFLKLGSEPGASEIKTKIMGDSLLSDMQSFKAANPCCVFEDFIRWYSPRDWLENENGELDEYGQKKGMLSKRFQLPDNIWLNLWETSRPIPADKQVKLFDYMKEGKEILEFLYSRTIKDVIDLLLPIILHAIIVRLVDEIDTLASPLAEASQRILQLIKYAQKFSQGDAKQKEISLALFIEQLTNLELEISVINSLQYKLNPCGIGNELVNLTIAKMVKGKQTLITDNVSLIRMRLTELFTNSENSSTESNRFPDKIDTNQQCDAKFPAIPDEKEYVLKAYCIRPHLASCKSPQFLRVIVNNNEYGLVGAFSEDTAFF